MRVGRSWIIGIFGAILLISGVSIYTWYGLDKTPPPRIEIIPDSHDFGVVPYRAVAKYFTLKNRGGSLLRITGLSTSCGCTEATVEKEELLPGEETRLLVTFDPNLMSEPVVGKIYRVVYVTTNDPSLPEAEIEIRATVEEGGES
ncbi:MAG: DUF1573 domain-containing protein [Fidelibacterota bacterium]